MQNKIENTPLYVGRLHWLIFLWPLIFTVITLGIGFYVPEMQMPSLIFALAGLAWFAMTWIQYRFSSLTIGNNQVTLRSGFLSRQTIDIPIHKIESVDIRQSITGTIFGYGWLLITGTGGTRYGINLLSAPLTCRRYIEQLINERPR